MKTIFDICGWIIAFVIIYFISHFSLIGIFYSTEFIFRIVDKMPTILLTMAIFPMLIVLWYLVSLIMLSVCRLIIAHLVRQTIAFSTVLMIFYSISIILFLFLFWKGVIEFGWQSLKYHKAFEFFFTFFFIGIFILPYLLRKGFLVDKLLKGQQIYENINESGSPIIEEKSEFIPESKISIIGTKDNEKRKGTINLVTEFDPVQNILKRDLLESNINSNERIKKIFATNKTPEVILNPEGIIRFKGQSIPENAMDFYESIDVWISEYICNPAEITSVDINLERINGVSCKYLNHILQKITYVTLKQKKFIFNWYYKEGDDDIFEIGNDLAYSLAAHFNFIKIT
jgi:hypothetical protein